LYAFCLEQERWEHPQTMEDAAFDMLQLYFPPLKDSISASS